MTTETDRELLELAAKAAGAELDYTLRLDGRAFYHSKRNALALADGGWFAPLTDDGDALRLAIVCRINVQHWDGPLRISAEHPDLMENSMMQETLGGPMWAARNVIVRAAAAIGKEMK